MSRGRKPEGPQAMSGAERQARYRDRHALAGAESARGRGSLPEITLGSKNPRAERRRSRHQRWRAAITELLTLQAEYAAWLDALPEATRDGATVEALRAIADLDLDEIAAIDPPRGFGREASLVRACRQKPGCQIAARVGQFFVSPPGQFP